MRSRIEHVRDLLALGHGTLRVQSRSDRDSGGKAAGNWFAIHSPDAYYHLRAVLPCELVFDIGDHVPFASASHWTNAVAQACLNLRVPTFWVALSAGKGLHVHIFGKPTEDCRGRFEHDGKLPVRPLPPLEYDSPITFADGQVKQVGIDWDADGPDPLVRWVPSDDTCDWRGPVSRRILDEAVRICGDLELVSDPLLIQPHDESRMCREFGALKDKDGTDAKILWFDSALGLPYDPIPPDRTAAYKAAKAKALGWPQTPVPTDLSHLDLRWLPHGCPRSADCLTGHNVCDPCPLGA